jgi:hypothetical protein
MVDGINLDDAVASKDDGSNSSSGNDTSNRQTNRSDVFVKEKYGTTLVPKDTNCQECTRRAYALVVGADRDESCPVDLPHHYPACPDHYEELEDTNRFVMDKYDVYYFGDEE